LHTGLAAMAGPSREQALSLLAAANNHGDLAVKLSSLKQAKDILLAVEPSVAGELFPCLVELQSSPESLVRKALIEYSEKSYDTTIVELDGVSFGVHCMFLIGGVAFPKSTGYYRLLHLNYRLIDEIGLQAMEHSVMLIPVLLSLLKDDDSVVARKSIISGTHMFCSVLEELTLQFRWRGKVERWLEELWTWMVKFKDAVFNILLEAGSVGMKLLAIKFLESYILLFTSDASDSKKSEAMTRNGWVFNVSWLVGGHPVLDPLALMSEANRSFSILLDLLRPASSLPASLTISVVNCLAAIARKRPVHYSSVLSVLLEFDSNLEAKGGHTTSIQYSLRTAFLGFLRCTYPAILESREKLLRALRVMNAGDAADQVLRQVDKVLKNNDRASRDNRSNKEEQPSNPLNFPGDLTKKRPLDYEEPTFSHDVASKRLRYGPNSYAHGQDNSVNGVSPKVPLLNCDLTPVEQMIAMIGALIAEGERGAESLEILISQIHPDLLADIVITNMKHLPNVPPPVMSVTQKIATSSNSSQVVAPIDVSISPSNHVINPQVPLSASNAISTSLSDLSTSIVSPADSKRDPRRDPRRLDPRRVAAPAGVSSLPVVDDNTHTELVHMMPKMETDSSVSLLKPLLLPVLTSTENISVPIVPKTETDLYILGSPVVGRAEDPAPKEEVLDEAKVIACDAEDNVALDIPLSPVTQVDQDLFASKSSDIEMADEAYSSSLLEVNHLSPSVLDEYVSEEACPDLPELPLYVELTDEQQRNVRKLAVERIIDSYKHLGGKEYKHTCMAVLARLVAQIDVDDDVAVMIQKHIVSDYQHQKGHELVMHVLYHLHTLMISNSVEHSSAAAVAYEKFLLGVAKSLLDALPAADKSFSRLLGEVPLLPDPALKLLEELCCSPSHCGKDVREGDRVTQGLGAVWSLILSRPLNRQACLDIALKCAVHPQDDIRAKAIRLVANKLYIIDYISENIEQFATSMLLSAFDQRVPDIEVSQFGATEQGTEGEVGSQETSISGSQISEPGPSENDSVKGVQSDFQSDSSVSFAQAQRHISLFFALCTKKPSLLQLVFDHFSRAPKSVKQAFHRHIPVLIRALGSSYSELLHIISDPPQGSGDLLTQVLQILSEGTVPLADLVATVKRLYETKLKDATILIPMLSSFSKNEVLPIFPRLVALPLDKFQTALAHILQGSAHTGPALTPAEVLVAIHDISPEKDGLALKKARGTVSLLSLFILQSFVVQITDACSACFEQRTVFTQHVLAKALSEMVDQTHLPLLFMRTVIQAIDAFPTLVDFVMEILSKLVSKQVWRMPKLWVGFLKCVSQTQPHSFSVLLQLPSNQLEGALTKYGILRGPLAAYASQPSIQQSLPRSTLVILGLANESFVQQTHHTSSLHAPDKSSSVRGAT
ncbi:hypothetical protein RJ639_047638, partial [Escallonia herrerae]